MVQVNEVQRIHERIDVLSDKIDAMNLALTRNLVQCEPCRSTVMGNGKPGIDKRVDRLEQRHAKDDKWFWLLLGGVPTIISAVIGAAVHWVWSRP